MHILMISIGKDILCEGSSTQKRHFEYGKICESLDIIVLGNYTKLHQTEHDPPFPSTGGHIKGGNNENVKIYAAGGNNKISRFFRACALAGEIAKNNKIDLVTTQDAVYTGLIG